MKSKLMTAMGVWSLGLSALVTVSSAAAEDPATPATTRPVGKDAALDREAHPARLGTVVKASEAIGKEVDNLQGEKIGKIEDMAIDVESGRILEILVSSGGVLGVGDRVVAVPPAAFSCEPPHPTLRLDATKEKIKGAPAFEISKWSEFTQTNHVMEGYRYFGKEPYFAMPVRNDVKAPLGYPTSVERASKVIGATVKNEANEKLGKVDNLMVDVEAGRIVHVVLSSGGFLGVGDELRAIPPNAFRYQETDHTLFINATKDTVSNAPQFKTGEYTNLNDSAYSARVYRAYRVEPYFTVDVDNTRRNVRDRDDRQLTPTDQGTSAADVDLTRRIRKEILDHPDLSVNARNIKVITINGRVTLRGPVSTAAEKRALEDIAQRLATTANVDSQLEIKDLNR